MQKPTDQPRVCGSSLDLLQKQLSDLAERNRVDYQEYLQSPAWKFKRECVLAFWDHSCALCSSPERVEVHHRTYERLGRELLTDLIVLCEKCHEEHHEKLGRSGLRHISTVFETLVVP